MTDKNTIRPHKRPQFYEVKARMELEKVPLRTEQKNWLRMTGPISRLWLEAGWQGEDTARGLVEPSPHYNQIAAIYNNGMLQALGGTPTLGQFRQRMKEQAAQLPALLPQEIPGLSNAQGAAIAAICHDYCDKVLIGHLVTHMEAPKAPKR